MLHLSSTTADRRCGSQGPLKVSGCDQRVLIGIPGQTWVSLQCMILSQSVWKGGRLCMDGGDGAP